MAIALLELRAGRIREAREVLDLIIHLEPEGSAFQIAEIYAEMGEIDKAFEYLAVAVKSDPGITQIIISPQLRRLHADDRWHPLLRTIGIPEQYWPEV